MLSLCFRGGREGGSRVPSQNHCDTKTDPEVSWALPATKTGTLFDKPEREISLCHKTFLSRLCQVLPCGMGSEPAGSSELQMNPEILPEPRPCPRSRRPSECPVVQGKELLNGLESRNSYFVKFNVRLVWYLYELNGIWPFYYLLLGSVFPLLGFCP